MAGSRFTRRTRVSRQWSIRSPPTRLRPTGRWSCGPSSTVPAGWRRRAIAASNHWTGGFANSAGQTLTGEAVECGLSGIARERRRRRCRPPRPARRSPSSTAPPSAPAPPPRHSASAEPIELPPGHYEVVLEPTAVADILESLAVGRVQRQGGQRAAIIRATRRGSVRSGDHVRRRSARRRARLRQRRHTSPAPGPRRPRHDRVADPRPPLGGRGRRDRRPGMPSTRRSRRGRPPATSGSCRRATRPALPARSTGRPPTRPSPSWSPASSGACWCPTSGTPACSTRAPSPSPA